MPSITLLFTKLQHLELIMATSTVEYLGNLRTNCTHLASNMSFVTDAPVDNNGKGEAFSPTDVFATSYASCMMTIMGIYCESNEIPFTKGKATVTKIMESNPRRVGRIEIEMNLEGNDWDEKTTQKVIAAGKACPVAKTLGDNVEVVFSFIY